MRIRILHNPPSSVVHTYTDYEGISDRPNDVLAAPFVALVQSEDDIYTFGLERQSRIHELKEYLKDTQTPYSRIQLRVREYPPDKVILE